MTRILYAEDNENVRKSLIRFLSGEGYLEITAVENGKLALDLLHAGGKFDVLITDGTMPLINGQTLLARPEVKEIPVRILLSGDINIEGISKKPSGHWEIYKLGIGVLEALPEIIKGTYKSAGEPVKRDGSGVPSR